MSSAGIRMGFDEADKVSCQWCGQSKPLLHWTKPFHYIARAKQDERSGLAKFFSSRPAQEQDAKVVCDACLAEARAHGWELRSSHNRIATLPAWAKGPWH